MDYYLISFALMIFSFGMYELFISEIDIARVDSRFGSILEIESLDDPTNKIRNVIIKVLIMTFFQGILLNYYSFTQFLYMLAMAVSICMICIGVYMHGRHAH